MSGGPAIIKNNAQIFTLDELFKHLSIADSNVEQYEPFTRNLICDIICIVHLNSAPSPECSRAMELVYLILDVLDAGELRTLKDMLRSRRQAMTLDTTDEERDHLDYAVQWMQGVQSQISLQNLARRAIVRAMSHRSIRGVDTLGLPSALQRYVMYDTKNK